MNTPDREGLTELLKAAGNGDAAAADEVLPLIYETLRSLARRHLCRDGGDQTIEPTALVHEAWVRLMGPNSTPWEHRAHFFGSAARAMRRILVERARKARRSKHGGDRERVPLTGVSQPEKSQWDEVLALEELLPELEALDRRKHDVVLLRYYAGLSVEEAARALDISPATVKADWSFARSWLKSRLRGEPRP